MLQNNVLFVSTGKVVPSVVLSVPSVTWRLSYPASFERSIYGEEQHFIVKQAYLYFVMTIRLNTIPSNLTTFCCLIYIFQILYIYIYIYILAFSRRFYPKRLTAIHIQGELPCS